jgi:Rrf2 family protein
MNNSKFSLATQILALMAIESEDCPITSEYLAESANTHPVVIRRMLAALRSAGLVIAQPGPHGGVSLKRNPAEITLRQVYQAAGETEIFPFGDRTPSADCICGRNIQPVLADINLRVEHALERTLQDITLEQIVAFIKEREARPINFEL